MAFLPYPKIPGPPINDALWKLITSKLPSSRIARRRVAFATGCPVCCVSSGEMNPTPLFSPMTLTVIRLHRLPTRRRD